MIERVRKLPHIVYGGKHGSKAENMVRHIQSEGRKKEVEVETRYPKGVCRPELLDIIKPYLDLVETNVLEQRRLSKSILNDLAGIEPTNEPERLLVKRAKIIAGLLYENQHIIAQNNFTMGEIYYNQEEERETITDDGQDKEIV